MDFQLNKEQEMLKTAVAEFCEKEIAPYEAKWDAEQYFPVELFPRLGRLGILGIVSSKEYCGAGMKLIDRAIVMEELGFYSPGIGMAVNSQHLGIGAILEFGTEEQKKKYLPDLCMGKKITCLGTTEAQSGVDVAGQKTEAKFVDGKWIINVHKCLLTNADFADFTIITAKTGEDKRGKTLFTAFILKRGLPGISQGRRESKLGLRTSEQGELFLDDVEVEPDCVLGEVGKGTLVAMKQVSEIGRAGMTAVCVGITRAALELGVNYAQQRIIYGENRYQIFRQYRFISQTVGLIMKLQDFFFTAATLKDIGKSPATPDFSIAKLYGDAACRASKSTIEILGGYGIIQEYGAEKIYRDAVSAISGGGTNEIQRVIVANDTIKNLFDIRKKEDV
ncbi:acyl-CoA dehydrogenase family protein [Finegoldia magna]|uniref:acyl-CoA dehydrogenase family protein n=1 Tax=Finegoldia magna TaxID=1260 RepID=UPI00399B3878